MCGLPFSRRERVTLNEAAHEILTPRSSTNKKEISKEYLPHNRTFTLSDDAVSHTHVVQCNRLHLGRKTMFNISLSCWRSSIFYTSFRCFHFDIRLRSRARNIPCIYDTQHGAQHLMHQFFGTWNKKVGDFLKKYILA